jgi:hypothetical protein
MPIIQNVAVIIAAIIALHGINSWRREIRWKKKYELIEDTLVLFYEADEKIKILRFPGSWGNEGNTRKKSGSEAPEETQSLNQKYVIYERWEKDKDVFNKLQTIKFRFIAIFGKDFLQPFEEVQKILNEIFFANYKLNNRYWLNQRETDIENPRFKAQLEKITEYETKVWDSLNDNDDIRIRIKEATKKIEVLYNKILGRKYHN